MPQKLIDIKGCRFEKLTAIKYVGNEKWRCKCDCGNEIFATGNELRKGRRTNCGCSKKTNLNDLTGRKFGRLTVICRAESVKGNTRWDCECECGNKTTVSYSSLISGRTKSCGCWHDEALTINKKTHGMSKTKLYRVYRQMIERCYRENNEAYHNYGGRGIRVCPEWLGKSGADSFFKWAKESGYKENKGRNVLTLDRKDGRSWKSRRGYMESKELHKANTPEDKQQKMRDLEAYTKELAEDITEMIADMSAEEKNLLRTKMQTLAQKIQ